MRPKLSLLIVILLAGLCLVWAATARPVVATIEEREVIKAALADPQFPSRCIGPVTNPDLPSSGYGFSNGGSMPGEVWLDRKFMQAQGRGAILLADGAEDLNWMRFIPAPLRSADCIHPVTLHTPVFHSNLAFVGFSNHQYYGLIAFERVAKGWEFVSITKQNRGPVI